MTTTFEIVVVGAGVIGTAVARVLSQNKKVRSVAVLEKEAAPALHTSGRNSGVIHSGINPKPGTLKAKFCVEGNKRLREFCRENNLPFSPVGTLVVAKDQKDLPVLQELLHRGTANGVSDLKIIDSNELKQIEPHSEGQAALHAPSGAIASGQAVTQRLAEEAQANGCQFLFHHQVLGIEESGDKIIIDTNKGAIRCRYLINCAGLYADDIAHKMDVGTGYTIVPFRGEYYRLKPELNHLLNSMLYPIPDLAYPFLGVHWTKKINGEVWIGPNATMAWGRESYRPTQINVRESLQMVLKRSFWKMLSSTEFRTVAWEQFLISVSRSRFVREAQKLIPGVNPEDFIKGKSGNRAQLVDNQGNLVEDMLLERKGNSLHVLNTVSPGFTCALPFADHIVQTLFYDYD